MINIRPEDAIHKSYLNRLLIEISDNSLLSINLAFKGGTAAAMLGYLDRFSVDLDFDLVGNLTDGMIREEMNKIFKDLGLEIVKSFDKVLMWQVKYPSNRGRKNLKLSVSTLKVLANKYEVKYFTEIDRVIKVQTIETMFANKLVAVIDRYDLHKTIAGRDIYDVHHFFVSGYKYDASIIKERTGLEAKEYCKKLFKFVKDRVNQQILDEDLNILLQPEQFRQIRKVILPEVLGYLKD